jgi:hypothetical protein
MIWLRTNGGSDKDGGNRSQRRIFTEADEGNEGLCPPFIPPEDHRAVERNETQGISRENAKMNTKFHNKASKAAKMRDRKSPLCGLCGLAVKFFFLLL